MNFRSHVLATIVTGLLMAAPLGAMAQDAKGAGSRFAGPLLERWTEMAQTQGGVKIAYDPIGSSRGHNKILDGTADFAISDAPMPATTLANEEMVQFPIAVGAVVPVVNVPGIAAGQLKLNGVLLAKIYTGKIKTWNDPEIVALNPGLKLPAMDIRPVWQADYNGPTHSFTGYLLAANADWREKFGAVVNKRWAIGSSVAGNDEVYEVMKTLPGSIGYLDFSLAKNNDLITVQLQGKAGKFLSPDPSGFAAALAGVSWDVPDMVFDMVNLPGDNSWPILAPIYVQMPSKPKDQQRNLAVLKFFEFALGSGGSAVRGRNLAPLPQAARAGIRQQWAKIQN